MNKVLFKIFSILILISNTTPAHAYQTVLIDFPPKDRWHVVYNQTQGNETILQYVPQNESYQRWTRTIIFHSYRDPRFNRNAYNFLYSLTSRLESMNSTGMFRFLKNSYEDSIATRCVEGNSNIARQCEIFRVTQSQEGILSIHYINRNVDNFKYTYNQWYKIIKDIKTYYSHFRYDRIMSKSTSFEI